MPLSADREPLPGHPHGAVFGVVGWKNTGKTHLVGRLIEALGARGVSVSSIKHTHHAVDLDHPGSDSFRHREAGAREVVLVSRARSAVLREGTGEALSLVALLRRLEPVDLVLVEGMKAGPHPKIEAHRSVCQQGLIAPTDPSVLAVAASEPPADMPPGLPLLALDDTEAIVAFILEQTGLAGRTATDAHAPGDCTALPEGINWTPVDTALTHLRTSLHPVVGEEQVPLSSALGRVLATPVAALRAHPPTANSAVDGYGCALPGEATSPLYLPLLPQRAAAGAPFGEAVPPGYAVRILTGAALPPGVDTVVMEEHCQVAEGRVRLGGRLTKGSNTRPAGEDSQRGAPLLRQGRKLTAADLALAATVGHASLPVRKQLQVGVLSTGSELREAGAQVQATDIWDANRPLLLGMMQRLGYGGHDLGICADHRQKIADTLTSASHHCDVILTSGGASAGDEDHMSALLRENGTLAVWRVALKPGRPLALGYWNGVPVFALPGNPVAAWVCALIFATPALSRLAGGAWQEPQGYNVPAAFEKRKKAGRREYLRARIRDGQAEIFPSEGSGRVSGISWAEGLIDLPEPAAHITPGTPVRYLPFSSFGL